MQQTDQLKKVTLKGNVFFQQKVSIDTNISGKSTITVEDQNAATLSVTVKLTSIYINWLDQHVHQQSNKTRKIKV